MMNGIKTFRAVVGLALLSLVAAPAFAGDWYAGGSLGQLLMPAIVIAVLVVRNQDNFGASIGLWWLGQSLKDLAPYINDARDLQLPLLTGHSQDVPETHDWANLLLDTGLIFHEKKIAFAADLAGTLVMLLAMAWGGYILLQQRRNLENHPES